MTFYAGELFGVPIIVNWLHFPMLLLFWWAGVLYLRRTYKGAARSSYIAMGFICLVALFFSMVIHEFAHGLTSELLGIKILEARLMPLGAGVLPEVALSETTPIKEFLVAVAGPFSNMVIGAITAFIVWKWRETLSENTVQFISVMNFRLAFLNLVPVLSLDGAKAVHSILWGIGLPSDYAFIGTSIVGVIFLTWYFFLRNKEKKYFWQRIEYWVEHA